MNKDIIKIKNKPIPLRDRILFIGKSKWPMIRPEISKILDSNLGTTKQVLYELRKEGKLESKFNGKNNYYLWFKID